MRHREHFLSRPNAIVRKFPVPFVGRFKISRNVCVDMGTKYIFIQLIKAKSRLFGTLINPSFMNGFCMPVTISAHHGTSME